MRNKKDESAEPTPGQLLEAKVDAMMDPKAPTQQEAQTPETELQLSAEVSASMGGDLPPLDIFSDPKTAPEVPKDLLKQLGTTETGSKTKKTSRIKVAKTAEKPNEAAEESTETSPEPEPVNLDDPATDAAVDDIVAHEGDEVLQKDDEEQQIAAAETEPVEKIEPKHHHRIFWTLIFLLVLMAALATYILVSGSGELPGSSAVQHLVNNLHKR